MNMRSVPLPNPASLSSNKAAGVVVWMIGAWTTGLFFRQLGVAEPLCWLIAVGVQYALTRAESPIWRGKKLTFVGGVAALFDTAFNAAGMWPYVRDGLANTAFWTFIADALQSPSAPTLVTKLSMTVVAGAILAAAPEYFYHLEG